MAAGDDPSSRRFLSWQEVQDYTPGAGRQFFSAIPAEIQQGLTSDIYFFKTRTLLEHLQETGTEVTAEVFTRERGILAGMEEVRQLLQGVEAEVWSLPELAPLEPGQPVMRIRGAYYNFALLETALLGMLASSTGWATRAREVAEVAHPAPVFCFGARHLHPAVAPVMERIAIKAGMDGASCVLGAKLAGCEPSGTIPHALVLVSGDTLRVARAYDQVMPSGQPRTILVDTFKDEAEETLRVAEELGDKLDSVRLDTPSERGRVSPALVREVRARLDLAGHEKVGIFVSGGITPDRIPALKEAGADGFGVGSFVSAAPPVDMTMDIKEVNGEPRAKRGRIPGLEPDQRLQPWS